MHRRRPTSAIIARDTIAAGGGVITSTSFTIRATVGQIDVFSRTSESYHLRGGIWTAVDTSAASGTPVTITYKYDPLGRLVEADYSTGESFEYAYDAVGNRTAMTTTESTTTYEYDAANRLTRVGDTTYTWDERGNLTHDGTFTYTYNAAGRMVRAENVTTTLVYTYSADGLRVAQSVDGDATAYAWDWASGLPEMLSDGASLYLVGHDTLGRFAEGEWAYHLGVFHLSYGPSRQPVVAHDNSAEN